MARCSLRFCIKFCRVLNDCIVDLICAVKMAVLLGAHSLVRLFSDIHDENRRLVLLLKPQEVNPAAWQAVIAGVPDPANLHGAQPIIARTIELHAVSQ